MEHNETLSVGVAVFVFFNVRQEIPMAEGTYFRRTFLGDFQPLDAIVATFQLASQGCRIESGMLKYDTS